MSWLTYYTILAYVAVMLLCLAGSFSRNFKANFFQQLGFFMLALLAAYRITAYSHNCLYFYQEALAVRAGLFFGLGTIWKTWRFLDGNGKGKNSKADLGPRGSADVHNVSGSQENGVRQGKPDATRNRVARERFVRTRPA